MKFTFEESEIINNFFENERNFTKDQVIETLTKAKENTEDLELVEIAINTINKIKGLDGETVSYMLMNLPIDIYTEY